MRRVPLVAFAFWMAACSVTAPASQNPTSTDKGLAIFNDNLAEALIQTCSREAPVGYDGRWDVAVADVAKAEEALLRDNPEVLVRADIDENRFRSGYVREYGGFTRDEKNYLYGSYGSMSGSGLCDGGRGFFGVEYEMPSGRVTHSAHNGRG